MVTSHVYATYISSSHGATCVCNMVYVACYLNCTQVDVNITCCDSTCEVDMNVVPSRPTPKCTTHECGEQPKTSQKRQGGFPPAGKKSVLEV